jgi:ABC-type sugar transport system ATPase subunit
VPNSYPGKAALALSEQKPGKQSSSKLGRKEIQAHRATWRPCVFGALRARYGVTVILVEHVMKLVMASCDIVSVIDHGEKIAEGPPDEIREDHRVIEAYLGKEMKDAEVRAFLKA